MDINKKILPFGEYFLMMLRAGKSNFLQLLATMLLFFLVAVIIVIIFIIPIVFALANYITIDMLQDTDTMINYFYSGEIINYIYPALPSIAVMTVICSFLFLYFSGVQYSMVYLIADSCANNEKRSFGKMLGYSFKRSFPVMGTTLLLSLICIAVSFIFMMILGVIGSAMGVYSNINSLLYSYNYSIQPELIAYSIITFFILLAMVCVLIYISIIYSMAIFARTKYKLSGIATLRYSRKLTKGKRGKIFGNALLIMLIFFAISFILSYASGIAVENYIPFIPFLINLIVSFISMLVYIFWAVIFINFDKVKGQEILKSKGFKAGYIKDEYFPDSIVTDETAVENVKNEPKEVVPAAEEKAVEQAKDNTDEPTMEQVKDDLKENNTDEEKQEPEQKIIPDEKEKNE